MNHETMRKLQNKNFWIQAMNEELDALQQNQT